MKLYWDNLVHHAGSWRPWRELVGGATRGAVVVRSQDEALSALAVLADSKLGGAIVDAARLTPELEADLHRLEAGDGSIWILSSGTTGPPRFLRHTLETLATVRDAHLREPRRWLFPYAPGTYAWFQCALLGLTVPGQSVMPLDPSEAGTWAAAAAAAQIDAVSGTPTFWRRALLHHARAELAGLRLAQVTLGGEPVDQNLLDRLAALYPDARLTHIYASAEAGACIVVSDGLAGFPADWLEAGTIAVREGRLFVRSRWAGLDLAGDWLDTGDLAQLHDDRIEIVGRAQEDVANVGGAKVVLADVSAVLAGHPDVAWARARARSSTIVGELVVAEVCLQPGAAADETDLLRWCAERLPEVARPRLIAVLDDIPATLALKAPLR